MESLLALTFVTYCHLLASLLALNDEYSGEVFAMISVTSGVQAHALGMSEGSSEKSLAFRSIPEHWCIIAMASVGARPKVMIQVLPWLHPA